MAHVIVIGSGFGGSIAAKRFTEAGHTVALIELGEDFRDGTKLQQSQDTKYLLRLFRDYPADYMQSKPKLVVTQGMGLGGGSLVYSGIHLRAPSTAFAGWPTGYTRPNLDPYYSRFETRAGVAKMADTWNYRRPARFAEAAAAAGIWPRPKANPLAMTNCLKCGWCVPICKWGRKNTMQHTYLQDAINTGRLSIWTNRKVQYVAKYGAKYRVVYWLTNGVTYNYHMVNSGPTYYQEADYVVVAGGTMESPGVLQRSLAVSLPAGYTRISTFNTTNLGKKIDGTGDFVVGGFLPVGKETDSYKGAIMMAHIDKGDYVLQDIHGIPAGPSVKFESAFYMDGRDRTWGLAYKQKFKAYGSRMLGIAVIGKSPSGGNMSVSDSNGRMVLSSTPYQPPPGSLEAARSMITALGGELVKTPWDRNGTAATVHPVGGCGMGSIVQPTNLQVYNNPGLYVIDGSVLPGSPFRNPSSTIAAIAEKAMDVILQVPGAPTW